MSRGSDHLFGIYVHWPYCLSKCPYCDFFSLAGSDRDEEALLTGYRRDILFYRKLMKKPQTVTSVFFGGGTPSLMSADFFKRVLADIAQVFEMAPSAEITLEANPDAIDGQKMRAFAKSGVNRLSLGVQSLYDADLKQLGRRHTAQTAVRRIREAQEVFDRINIDLIYARPRQTVTQWADELGQALTLGLNHYSLYQLTIEENTPFERKGVQGAPEEVAAEMFVQTNRQMEKAGIPAYEISNYAADDHRCLHNLTYWRGFDYVGIGPAAHGRIENQEIMNPRSVPLWLKQNPCVNRLTAAEKLEERVLMGLRLRREGFPVKLLDEAGVKQVVNYKWGEVKSDLLFLSQEGALMLDQVILTVCPAKK